MPEEIITKQIRVFGIVQGVGFRPTVDRIAHRFGIRGTVSNRGSFVEIFARGDRKSLDLFLEQLKNDPPRRSVILNMEVRDVRTDTQYTDFRITESSHTGGEIFISPDIAICEDCRRELFDPADRRYLHPFINCTCCGPRLTILDRLPYDRERTSMKMFPMCRQCAREYRDPRSRRYDAQPVCCNDCGPEVYLLGSGNSIKGRDAITFARRVLAEGGIVAVKGVGGFHLACDAANDRAVQRLRTLKTRPMKPFAVMAKDQETAERECEISPAQQEVLTGHQKPIILLPRKRTGTRVSEAVAPGQPCLGMMLPYAPIQLLLFTYDDNIAVPDLLVMTSGNRRGAPIARDDSDAQRDLAPLCDAILSNNRPIRVRADDSVTDFYRGEPYIIRRSRGYAPLPVRMSENFHGRVLAIGGELKNTFCLTKDQDFYPSSYIGDLADPRAGMVLRESVERMQTLLEMQPQIIACDLHPGYHSSEIAQELADREHIPLLRIQHHYAHVLSCMAENDLTDPVIGVALDGTGYGTDGTVWGGEILVSSLTGFERRACIHPFIQQGGDLAARQGWRIAAAMLQESDTDTAAETMDRLGLADRQVTEMVIKSITNSVNTMKSTSAGRLFDAVSAILGIRKESTYEGEAASALMNRAVHFLGENSIAEDSADGFAGLCGSRRASAEDLYSDLQEEAGKRNTSEWNLRESDRPRLVRTDLLVRVITKYRLRSLTLPKADRDRERDRLAYFFHTALADLISREVLQISRETGISTAALTGGVYQNRLLLALTQTQLEKNGLRVIRHHLIPPNDGGIALGQALAAAIKLKEDK